MKATPLLAGRRPIAPALAAFCLLAAPARGQQPAATPNPQAPTLNMPLPLGAQRGSTQELTLTGTNLAEPTGLWTSFPAQVSIPSDHQNGKDNGKLRVRLEVPRDAPLGFHSIRLATSRGLSNLRLFCIDDLPQILETGANRSRATTQTVPVPCVVVGRADAEQNSYFKIHVRAGQRVSFEVLGRRLGSAFDPQLTLYEPGTGRELPGGYSNDAPGLQTDARLTYTFKETGDCLVEIRDVMYRGGADFCYRLRIGDFPCATTPIPMAARRGSQVTVRFAGPAVEGAAPVEVLVPADPTLQTLWVAPRGGNGLYGWPVALAVSDHEELVEQEPNNDPAHANRVPVPGGVTGQFLQPGDVDCYRFPARKGQHLVVEAHTQALYSPTEVYMTLKDARGTPLVASNPATPPRLDFTAPADGDYTLAVEHLLYGSGPAESYRITFTPYEPDFDLALASDRFDVPPGTATPLGVQAVRRGYAGPIAVRLVGPPDLAGQATIAAGQPATTLYLRARPETPPGPYALAVEGSATSNGKSVCRYASVRAAVSRELAGLTYPPRNLLTQVGVGVTARPPFTLALPACQLEGTRGSPVPLTVTASRAPGFAEEIVLAAVGLPPTVPAALKNIPSGQSAVAVQLRPAANAPLGSFPISLTGKAKYQNREVSVTAPPVSLVLVLPFVLRAEPGHVHLVPGGKARLRVTAMRQGGYQGPIVVALRNLPANVAAPQATLAAGQTAVDIELTAATSAAAGIRVGANVLGTAPAAANQQAAPVPITVSIGKN